MAEEPRAEEAEEGGRGRRRGRARQAPQLSIIRIDSSVAEDYLFKQIAIQLLEPYTPEDFETRIEAIPKTVSRLVHVITKEYFSTPLGGQILDPRYSREILVDRVAQFIEILLSVQREYIRSLKERIRERRIRGEDFEYELKRILNNFDVIFIVARELMNRLNVLMQINLPGRLRPPLANVKLGYEIV